MLPERNLHTIWRIVVWGWFLFWSNCKVLEWCEVRDFCCGKNTISSKQTKMAKDLTISLHISSTRLQLLSLIATSGLCFCYHGFIPSETFCRWTWVPIRFSTLQITALKSRYKLYTLLHSAFKDNQVFDRDGDTATLCLAAATLLQHHLHRKGEGIAMIHQSIHQRSSTF